MEGEYALSAGTPGLPSPLAGEGAGVRGFTNANVRDWLQNLKIGRKEVEPPLRRIPPLA